MDTANTMNGFFNSYRFTEREEYERDLKERQRKHLEGIGQNNQNWQPCMHDQCSECHGTGRKSDGTVCVHMISCPCPKCTPFC